MSTCIYKANSHRNKERIYNNGMIVGYLIPNFSKCINHLNKKFTKIKVIKLTIATINSQKIHKTDK